MDSPADFITWALSPDRTIEEAYLAERIVENGIVAWRAKRKDYRFENWEASKERARARRLNPAHRLRLGEENVKKTAEMLPEMKRLDLACHDDRPVRDLSGLRFFPALDSLNISFNEIKDISPIASLSRLTELHVADSVTEDFRPLSRCTTLRFLVLRINQPWPILTGLENLSQVETFHYYGNLLPLEDVPILAGVKTCVLEVAYPLNLPPRNCHRLPAMPALQSLDLSTVHRLDGIGRWSTLHYLKVEGKFTDLTPITECRALTSLTLKGNVTRDLSPLVLLPKLRHLTVEGEHPQDYSVLAEAPLLHEVTAKGCDINKMELGALHAGFSPWSDEFAAPEPRPLKPLRFLIVPHKDLTKESPRGQGNDPTGGLSGFEGLWFKRLLRRRIAEALDHPKWGQVNTWGAGFAYITVASFEAAECLPEIVRVTREAIASARHVWHVFFFVDLDAEWERDDETDPELSKALQRQRQKQEDADGHIRMEKRRREHKEFLERLHRLRLLEQDGRKIEPDQFAAPDAPEIEPEQEEDEEDVDLGDVLVKQRKPKAPEPRGSHPLAKVLYMMGTITEDVVMIYDDNRLGAVQLMGREPDEG